ncbi:neural cell adhesion molecule 1 isoform X1 [Hippocampus zosterae]|uniref:neural cell adhesion molecule 1 isoform X1 n=1 Tax=Hippocampus zosterae TaxID=109293 RepID=UPI00223D71BB|nr:neural cell adhesion molecule 1 isoform X1 [Hippocampus zosterae]
MKIALFLLLLVVHSTDAKMDIITSKQDIQVGEELLLFCKAGGEGHITWQRNSEDIDEELISTVDESSSKLVIKSASMEDAGRYTCLCDFDNGHRDDVQTQIYVYEGPSFENTPTYHEFLEGTDGVVPCRVSGQPAVEVRWTYSKEMPSRGKNVQQLPDNTLLIEKVKRQDAGMYVCQAQIRGRPVFNKLPISVVVNAPPTVHLKEEVKKVIAGPDTNVSLLCLVDGQPKPNITWSMPALYDPRHHKFNSDRSQLTIRSVVRDDYGEYICTATNKIAESSATVMLHVFETPEVSLSVEQQNVSVGESVAVACNVSGLPQPDLHWINKRNGQTLDSPSGRIRVEGGILMIDSVVPSDGGLYSCMAVGSIGNASRDVAIHTQPGPPPYLSVSPGPASVFFSLKTPPISGGTPITNFILQWRQNAAEKWQEVTVPASDTLAVTSLMPYTLYTVRLAALNAAGRGQFSNANSVRTLGIRGEPDSPVLSCDEMKVVGNSFFIPLKQTDHGGTPLLHYNLRYREDKDRAEWKKKQLSSNTDSITLIDLNFGADYQLEVAAINANGSSLPVKFNFTIAEKPVRNGMTKGSVAGIVMVIFLVIFLLVDATCCYRNRCGLLMSIAVKLFGQKVPGLKGFEEGEGGPNGEVKMNGMSTPRGDRRQMEVQTLPSKEGGALTEVTCDKASLTKHEKTQPDRNVPAADA